jgi:hypothetical protein
MTGTPATGRHESHPRHRAPQLEMATTPTPVGKGGGADRQREVGNIGKQRG